ncbi:hypothetical protein GCM10012287_56330 [Streptomyces daqingensis]|uniref:DUF2637 domain-containing protein n=1 Tax=Streptomyces daqingensis TaxID=1472640 RepID=A0ABQ2MVT9_9ACTN|nr:DUF2637 domain-containing protein [Streptomyces daqingensis]GGO58356.1 hypothetical protein GCM10012287_56330 [Streptomyces daqingensis]
MTAAPPPFSSVEKTLLATVVPAGAGVGGLGLASSFDSVAGAAERWGFSDPWMLPVGIDVAIPVFTAANLLLIRLDMRLSWVRWVPWALTFVTCWLNIAAGDSASAKVAHGTMPLLWVGLSEVVAHVYAVRIGAATGARMERIRRSRWLLAPGSTFSLWRRMTLWEITSYREALEREKERQLSRAGLRERYGRGWRRQAPRRERVLLKLGELAPDGALTEPESELADDDLESEESRPPAQKPPPRPRRSRRRSAVGRPSYEQHLANARTATADWPDAALTAERIRDTVGCGQARSRELREELKAERRNQETEGQAPLEFEPATAG